MIPYITHPHPFIYFALTIFLTWIIGFFLTLIDRKNFLSSLSFVFFLLFSLLIPLFIAIGMIFYFEESSAFTALSSRLLLSTHTATPVLLFFIYIGLTYALSILLSTLFGQSFQQFHLSKHFQRINLTLFVNILIPLFASCIEECGWRLYGVDALRCYYNIRDTSLWFSFFWGIWHLPLFFIPGFYQYQLKYLGFVHVFNFFIGIIPASFLINWMYFNYDSNIMVAAICHFSFNLFAQYFQAGPITKIIVNIILLITTIIVYYYNYPFFVIV